LASAQWYVELDPARTTIDFRLKATLHSVDGRLPVISGSLVLDPATGAVAGVIVANATGAKTGNTSRDEKMHAKVLQSAEHPRIVFTPRSFEGDLPPEGPGALRIAGEMELLGTTHLVTLPVDVEIVGDEFTADARLEVPYVEWGLQDPSTFVLRVAKVVQVTLHAEGSVSEANQPGS
jgi:polyisoprenoid-binding protein YceI